MREGVGVGANATAVATAESSICGLAYSSQLSVAAALIYKNIKLVATVAPRATASDVHLDGTLVDASPSLHAVQIRGAVSVIHKSTGASRVLRIVEGGGEVEYHMEIGLQPPPTCLDGYLYEARGTCYKLMPSMPWNLALEACDDWGGELAEYRVADGGLELDWIKTVVAENQYPFWMSNVLHLPVGSTPNNGFVGTFVSAGTKLAVGFSEWRTAVGDSSMRVICERFGRIDVDIILPFPRQYDIVEPASHTVVFMTSDWNDRDAPGHTVRLRAREDAIVEGSRMGMHVRHSARDQGALGDASFQPLVTFSGASTGESVATMAVHIVGENDVPSIHLATSSAALREGLVGIINASLGRAPATRCPNGVMRRRANDGGNCYTLLPGCHSRASAEASCAAWAAAAGGDPSGSIANSGGTLVLDHPSAPRFQADAMRWDETEFVAKLLGGLGTWTPRLDGTVGASDVVGVWLANRDGTADGYLRLERELGGRDGSGATVSAHVQEAEYLAAGGASSLPACGLAAMCERRATVLMTLKEEATSDALRCFTGDEACTRQTRLTQLPGNVTMRRMFSGAVDETSARAALSLLSKSDVETMTVRSSMRFDSDNWAQTQRLAIAAVNDVVSEAQAQRVTLRLLVANTSTVETSEATQGAGLNGAAGIAALDGSTAGGSWSLLGDASRGNANGGAWSAEQDSISLIIIDDDVADLDVPLKYELAAGAIPTNVSVTMATQPLGTVTLLPMLGRPMKGMQVTPTTGPLMWTPENWRAPRRFTVNAMSAGDIGSVDLGYRLVSNDTQYSTESIATSWGPMSLETQGDANIGAGAMATALLVDWGATDAAGTLLSGGVATSLLAGLVSMAYIGETIGTSCGTLSETVLRVDGGYASTNANADNTRVLTTRSFVIQSGAELRFTLLGTGTVKGTPCTALPSNLRIAVEYAPFADGVFTGSGFSDAAVSVDANWTTLVLLDASTSMTSHANITVIALPEDARSNATRFRWRQIGNSQTTAGWLTAGWGLEVGVVTVREPTRCVVVNDGTQLQWDGTMGGSGTSTAVKPIVALDRSSTLGGGWVWEGAPCARTGGWSGAEWNTGEGTSRYAWSNTGNSLVSHRSAGAWLVQQRATVLSVVRNDLKAGLFFTPGYPANVELRCEEGKPAVVYYVWLEGLYTDDVVTVTIVHADGQLLITPSTLTFHGLNTEHALLLKKQMVTVSAVDDTDFEGVVLENGAWIAAHRTTIDHYSSSTNPAFDGKTRRMNATIIDNESPDVPIGLDELQPIREGGPTDWVDAYGEGRQRASETRYSITLASRPKANVFVDVDVANQSLGSVDINTVSVGPRKLTFTPSNWNIAQWVSITAIDDDVDVGNATIIHLSHVAVSSDTDYDAIPVKNVSVTVYNDDEARLLLDRASVLVSEHDEVVDPDAVDVSGDGRYERDHSTPLRRASALNVTANVVKRGVGGGLIATYRLRLSTRPLAPLTIEIGVNTSDSLLSSSQVTFVPNVVTISPLTWSPSLSTEIKVHYTAAPTPAPVVPSADEAALGVGSRHWNGTEWVVQRAADDVSWLPFPHARVGAGGGTTVAPLAKSAIFIALLPDESNEATDALDGRTALRYKRRRLLLVDDSAVPSSPSPSPSLSLRGGEERSARRRRLAGGEHSGGRTTLGTAVGWIMARHTILPSIDLMYTKVGSAVAMPREGEGGLGFFNVNTTGVQSTVWGYEPSRKGSIVIARGSNAQNELQEGETFGRSYGVALSRQPLLNVIVRVETTTGRADEAEKVRQFIDKEVVALSKGSSNLPPEISMCADLFYLADPIRDDPTNPLSWQTTECDLSSSVASGGKWAQLIFTPLNWFMPQTIRVRAVDDEKFECASRDSGESDPYVCTRVDHIYHTIVRTPDTDPAYDATRKNRYNRTVVNIDMRSSTLNRRYPEALLNRGGGAVAKNVVQFTSNDRVAALLTFNKEAGLGSMHVAWDRRRSNAPDGSNASRAQHLWLVEGEGDPSVLATRGGDIGSGYDPSLSSEDMGDAEFSSKMRSDPVKASVVDAMLFPDDGRVQPSRFVGSSSDLGAAAQPVGLLRYAPGAKYALKLSQAPPLGTVVVVRVTAERQGPRLFGSPLLARLLSDILGFWPIAEVCGHERLDIVPRVLLFDARTWNVSQHIAVTSRDDLDYQGSAMCSLTHVATSAKVTGDLALNETRTLIEGGGDGRFRSAHRSGNVPIAACPGGGGSCAVTPSIGMLWIAPEIDDVMFDGVVWLKVDDNDPWWQYRLPLVVLGWILLIATVIVLFFATFVAALDCASPSSNTWGLLAEAQLVSLVASTAGVRGSLQGLALVAAAMDPLAMRLFGLFRSDMLGGLAAPWPFNWLGIGHLAPTGDVDDANSDYFADARTSGGISGAYANGESSAVEHAPDHSPVPLAMVKLLQWLDVRDGHPLMRTGAASWLLLQLLPWFLLCCFVLGTTRSLVHRCFLSRRFRECWGEKCVCTKKWCCKGEQRQPIAPPHTQWPRWEVAVCSWFLRPLAAASAAALPLALFGFANPIAPGRASSGGGSGSGAVASSVGGFNGGAALGVNGTAGAASAAASAALASVSSGAITSPTLELCFRWLAASVAALSLIGLLITPIVVFCILCMCVRQNSPCRRVGYTKVALWVDEPKYVGFIDAWSPIFEGAKGWGQGEPSNCAYMNHWLHVVLALIGALVLGAASAECVLWRGDGASPGAALMARALFTEAGSEWEKRIAYDRVYGVSHAAIISSIIAIALVIGTIVIELLWLLLAHPLLAAFEGATMVTALALRAAFCGTTLAALVLIELGDAIANGQLVPWEGRDDTKPAPAVGRGIAWLGRGILEPVAIVLLVALLALRLVKEGATVRSSIYSKYMSWRLRWIKIAPSGKSRWAWEQENDAWNVEEWLREISQGVAIAWEQDGGDDAEGEEGGDASPSSRASPKSGASPRSRGSPKSKGHLQLTDGSTAKGAEDDNKSVASLGSLVSKAKSALTGFGSTASPIKSRKGEKKMDFADLYGVRFLGEGFTTREVVSGLTAHDLDYLDITSPPHRVIFLTAINTLREKFEADRREALGDEATDEEDFPWDEEEGDAGTHATSTGWSVAAWLVSLGPWSEDGVRKAEEKEQVKAARRKAWTEQHAVKRRARADEKAEALKARQTAAYKQLPAGGDEVVAFDEHADGGGGDDFSEESMFDSYEDWEEAEECPYEVAFQEAGYDDREAVLTIEDEDLDFLEITDPAHREKLKAGIEGLKHQYDKKHILDVSEMTEAEALAAALAELETEDHDPNVAIAHDGIPRPSALPSLVPVQPGKMSPYVGIPSVKVSELLGRQEELNSLEPIAESPPPASPTREVAGGKHKWLERRKRGILLATMHRTSEPPVPEDDTLVQHIEVHQRGWVQRKASMQDWAARLSPRPGHDEELLVNDEPEPVVPFLGDGEGEDDGEGGARDGVEGLVLDKLERGSGARSSSGSISVRSGGGKELRPESSPTGSEVDAEAANAEALAERAERRD